MITEQSKSYQSHLLFRMFFIHLFPLLLLSLDSAAGHLIKERAAVTAYTQNTCRTVYARSSVKPTSTTFVEVFTLHPKVVLTSTPSTTSTPPVSTGKPD